MHDWVLVSIWVEWSSGKLTITLNTHAHGLVEIHADGLVGLTVPKREEWGASVYVNEYEGPSDLSNGNQSLVIEMQSGDRIALEARLIKMPEL